MNDTEPMYWEKIYSKERVIKTRFSIMALFIRDPITNQARRFVRNGTICLEAGCGSGRIVLSVAHLCDYIVGLDFERSAIKMGRSRIRELKIANCDFVVGDVRQLPFRENSFDHVLSLGVIEHFSNPLTLIYAMKRCLAENGMLLIETPNKHMPFLSENRKNWLSMQYGRQDFYSPIELRRMGETVGLNVKQNFGMGFAWSLIMWFNDKCQSEGLMSRAKVLKGIIADLLYIVSMLLESFFHDRGFYSVLIAQKS